MFHSRKINNHKVNLIGKKLLVLILFLSVAPPLIGRNNSHSISSVASAKKRELFIYGSCILALFSTPLLYYICTRVIAPTTHTDNFDSDSKKGIKLEFNFPDMVAVTTVGSSDSLRSTLSFPADRWDIRYPSITTQSAGRIAGLLYHLSQLPAKEQDTLTSKLVSHAESELMQS